MNWTRWLLLLPLTALIALPALQGGDKKKEEPIPPRKIVSLDPRFDKRTTSFTNGRTVK